jgi:hypothetical protein
MTESPATNVDAYEMQTNFVFNPFRLIVENHILHDIVAIQRRDLPDDIITSRWWAWSQEYLEDVITRFEDELDPFLCRFSYHNRQQGVFMMERNIPGRQERHITFKVRGAELGASGVVTNSVDCPLMKPPIHSRYKHPGIVPKFEYILPNPDFTHTRTSHPTPDVIITTSFDESSILWGYEYLSGLPWPATQGWAEGTSPPQISNYLNSRDITPTGLWNSEHEPFGLRVKIRNRGTGAGRGTLKTKSIYIPFPRHTLDHEQWKYMVFVCEHEDVFTIEPRIGSYGQTEKIIQVEYDTVQFYSGDVVQLDWDMTEYDWGMWIISMVELKDVSGEILRSNNMAIDIQLNLPRPPEETSWWEDLWEEVKDWFDW